MSGLLPLLLLFILFEFSHAQQINRHRQQAFAEIAARAAPRITNRAAPRRLQLNATVDNFTEACSLCSGFPVKSNIIPRELDSLQGVPPNSTCGDLNVIFSTLPADVSVYSDCLAAQSLFAGMCCDFPAAPYVCEETVRSTLFETYDASVMPLPASRVFQVKVLLELLHISELNTKTGTVNVFVWLHLTWNDPRLAWEINDENCTTSITARASMDMERTEIFVPDIDLLNQVSGVQNFPDAMAVVYNDGTIQWKRSGGLKAFCFFTGLNRFPFDTLGCSYLIGAWVQENQVNITLGGDDNTGWIAGQSLDQVIYNEYTLAVEQTQSGFYYGLKSLVYYNLYFERGSRYYVLKVLLPTIVFTVLSFGVFFLDLRVGERLTYGLTVLLVIIAQDISTSTLLPITDQRLWITTFLVGSFYWVLATNLESVFVAWLYFLGDDDHDHAMNLHDNKGKRSDTTSGDTNQDEARPQEENLVASAVAVEPSAKENDEEEQAAAYGGLTDTLQDSQSGEHKTVAFSRDENGDGADEQDSTQKPNRRALFHRVASVGALSSRRLLTFRQLISQKKSTEKRNQTIKKIDTWCFWILSSTYILFVVVMFATNSLWDDSNELFVEGDAIPEQYYISDE